MKMSGSENTDKKKPKSKLQKQKEKLVDKSRQEKEAK